MDECASNPCLNGGQCYDGVSKYTCTCPTGYEGIRCETKTNECASNPCQHQGVCHDLDGRYRCDCAAGFAGKPRFTMKSTSAFMNFYQISIANKSFDTY